MSRKLTYAISLLLIQAFLFSSLASAHHFIWIVHDSAKQNSSFAGSESYANWWMINGAVSTYTADSTISTNVTTAVNNWNSSVPQVRIAGSGSDLTFAYSNSGCLFGSSGCYGVVSVYNDTVRGANFVTKGSITITNSSTNRTNTAAHEIGHFIGLHEQYRDDGSGTACNTVSSVMDADGCNTLTGPSSNDKFRVDNYLGNGWAEDLTASTVSSTLGRFTFTDRAYGELHYRVQLQKRSASGTWSTVSTQEVTNNTGLVKGLSWTTNKTVTADFYMPSFGAGTYRVEVAPYFKSYNKHGNVAYSPTITV